jgi:glycosyltransferase involved in cell wall biosynthesis
MKIGLDFTHNFSYSGIGTYNRELTKAMARQSPCDAFHLLTLCRKSATLKKDFGGIENMVITDVFPNYLMLGKLFTPLRREAWRLIWEKESRRLDVTHFTDPGFFASDLPNAVTTIHDIIPLYNATYTGIDLEKIRTCKTDKIIRQSRMIIVPSFFVKDELQKYFPEADGKVKVVYEGIKGSMKQGPVDQEIIRKYGVPDGQSFFLYVGRIDARKNLDNMLSAYRNLSEAHRKDVNLVLISKAGKKTVKKFHARINELGLSQSVYHIHDLPDEHLVHFYNAALALLFISFSEGFGLPLVEAMSCGCPSIISNVSSLPEIANGSSLEVDPYSVEAIRDGMMKFLENSELRSKLGEKCRQQALRYSWDSAARETLSIYRSAIC